MRLEDSHICGLVGVAGNINAKEESVFKRLLELDTIRGPHSTGILAVDSRGGTEIIKKVGTPWDLYQYAQYSEIMRCSLNVLMGHNRWATKGKINAQNAHPFEHDHIIGAHNGTLRRQELLPNHKHFEVDSDNIFHAISTIGVDETIAKTCGAFALTWYDAEAETMNFIRNDERPLWLCESEDQKTLFWASERWMLEVTLGLAGIKYRECYEPKSGKLHTYPIQIGYNAKAFDGVIARDVELYKYPVYVAPKVSSAAGTGNSSAGKSDTNGNKAEVKNGKKLVSPSDLIIQGKVEFFVSSLETSESTGQQWVSCQATQDNCEIELRVYAQDKAMQDWLMMSVHLFEGKVRGFSTVGEDTYMTLDPRSIIELIKVDATLEDDDPDFAVVFGGAIKTEEEYELLVCGGCVNCKSIPSLAESDDLVWLDNENFVCGDCRDNPVVKEFIEKTISTGSKAISTNVN